jgi:hypothetical protein
VICKLLKFGHQAWKQSPNHEKKPRVQSLAALVLGFDDISSYKKYFSIIK